MARGLICPVLLNAGQQNHDPAMRTTTVCYQARAGSMGLRGKCQLWAGKAKCDTSVQIDAAEARRVDVRSDNECGGRARDGAEEVRLP